jgi:hypothetical protein
MTEAHWLTHTDPMPMLEFLRGKTSDRKLLLFACACCRRVWDAIPLGGCQGAVLAAEQYCDGLIDHNELEAAHAAAQFNLDYGFGKGFLGRKAEERSCKAPAVAASCTASHAGDGLSAARATALTLAKWDGGVANPRRCDLLRDVVGNPFRPPEFDPSLRSDLVFDLAGGAYEKRDRHSGRLNYVRLVVLADALEEEGCTSTAILTHLRSPGPHVRGCWALDLVLGKQ